MVDIRTGIPNRLHTQKIAFEIEGLPYSSNGFVEEILQATPSLLEQPMVLRTLAIRMTKSKNKAMRIVLEPTPV